MPHQEPNQVHIAMEGCKVQRGEAIIAAAVSVQPRPKHLLFLFAIAVENNALIAGGPTVSIG